MLDIFYIPIKITELYSGVWFFRKSLILLDFALRFIRLGSGFQGWNRAHLVSGLLHLVVEAWWPFQVISQCSMFSAWGEGTLLGLCEYGVILSNVFKCVFPWSGVISSYTYALAASSLKIFSRQTAGAITGCTPIFSIAMHHWPYYLMSSILQIVVSCFSCLLFYIGG